LAIAVENQQARLDQKTCFCPPSTLFALPTHFYKEPKKIRAFRAFRGQKKHFLDKNLVRKEKINSCFSCLSWTKKNFRGQKPRPQGKKIRAFRAFRGQKKPFVDKNLVRKEKIIFVLFVDKKTFE